MKLRFLGLLICLFGLVANQAMAKGVTCTPKNSIDKLSPSDTTKEQQTRRSTNEENTK